MTNQVESTLKQFITTDLMGFNGLLYQIKTVILISEDEQGFLGKFKYQSTSWSIQGKWCSSSVRGEHLMEIRNKVNEFIKKENA